VAGAVARGDAGLGIATRAWAHATGLAFARLATEDYGLLLFAADLGRPEAVRLCETAQGPSFRSALSADLGYDAKDSGRLLLE
jgi:molybdate-binding protein